jgi:hypothetical protein
VWDGIGSLVLVLKEYPLLFSRLRYPGFPTYHMPSAVKHKHHKGLPGVEYQGLLIDLACDQLFRVVVSGYWCAKGLGVAAIKGLGNLMALP